MDVDMNIICPKGFKTCFRSRAPAIQCRHVPSSGLHASRKTASRGQTIVTHSLESVPVLGRLGVKAKVRSRSEGRCVDE